MNRMKQSSGLQAGHSLAVIAAQFFSLTRARLNKLLGNQTANAVKPTDKAPRLFGIRREPIMAAAVGLAVAAAEAAAAAVAVAVGRGGGGGGVVE